MPVKKILIVEDSQDMQNIYSDMFSDQKEKYSIDIIDNAEGGLEKVKKDDYALVLLDIIMKPMTGDSFLVRLRKVLMKEDLPVIVVSVLRPDILSNLKQFKNVSFMEKPVKKEELMKNISGMLG